MKKLYCGQSGSATMRTDHRLSDIPLPKNILTAFISFYGEDFLLRPAQENALFENDILNCTDNLIIATPTNSGKSLLSYLLLFKEAAKGRVTVLVEPLRALAYEKSVELKRIAEILKKQSNIKIDIKITTGDYRLTDEFMHSKPAPQGGQHCGQIIIATPERLDAISRIRDNKNWFGQISTICFDEAHLIGDHHRGATMELLIAFLLSLDSHIQIVLMSATIGNADELASWLSPCRIVSGVPRYPVLDKWVYSLGNGEDVDQVLFDEIQTILETPNTSVLVFVYQTASAEKLACYLASKISGKKIRAHDLESTMNAGAAWFHSKMSAATKESILHAMNTYRIRVAISTTALSMGINLPATHVFVRDIAFSGFGDLDSSDLLQMIGRAGRGDTAGTGIVMLTGNNCSKESTIVSGLTNETVPHIESQLIPVEREGFYHNTGEDLYYIDRVGNQIMGTINRYKAISLSGLEGYFKNTWGGERFTNLQTILRKLSSWKLAFMSEDTNEYSLTHLGKVASQCYLPPITAANIGQLFRDLLADNPTGEHISSLNPIDFLIILCLVSDETRPLVRYSKSLTAKVHAYMESLPLEEKSYLYRTWLSSSPEALLGSARVDSNTSDAEKRVILSTFTAMFIYDLSRGLSPAQLKEFYKVDSEEIQEKLRDNALWILCGIEQVLEVKSFYFHLKENCGATTKQIQQVDHAFSKSSKTIFTLIANLKFRSRLGELVRGTKRVFPHADSYPGEGTLRRLELAGFTSIKSLVGKTPADLVTHGIQQAYADMIISYIRKRMS